MQDHRAPAAHTKYAQRLSEIRPFKVMKLLARANELEASGCHVVHMEVGEPDFATPAPIVEAGERALRSGQTKYTPAQGILKLREQIAGYYASDHSIDLSPDRIFVTAGGSGALLLASAMLVNPGDGLLMTDPGYPCNRHFIKSWGGEGQLIPVTPDDGYQLTPTLIEQCWTHNTKGVLLASPANPTGAIVPHEDLVAIRDIVKRREGTLIVDEIYHGLTYTPQPVQSVVGLDEQAFVINSFSKYFGMTGWRLGWLVVPTDAMSEMEMLTQNLFICPSSIAQYAALAAFTPAARDIMEAQHEEFMHRRDFLVPALRALGFGVPRSPDGAFYIYAKLPEGVGPSESFCEWLLEEHFVAVTPGTDFGFYLADDHVRFSYARNLDVLAEGVERIDRALRGRV